MRDIYVLTLRQLAGKWRIIIMTALAGLPIVTTLIAVNIGNAPSVQDFENVVFSGMLMGSIAPLIVLAVSSAAFANEIEDRTLANLTLSPIPRWQIVVPKLLASITMAAPFVGVSAFVSGYYAFPAEPMAALPVAGAALVGVAVYASAFTWLGISVNHSIGAGLLYIVLWEGFFSGFVSGVRVLSIRHNALTVMHALDPSRFAGTTTMSAPVVLAISTTVFVGFLVLSVRRLRRMDVP